jgi:hypothetical protein
MLIALFLSPWPKYGKSARIQRELRVILRERRISKYSVSPFDLDERRRSRIGLEETSCTFSTTRHVRSASD